MKIRNLQWCLLLVRIIRDLSWHLGTFGTDNDFGQMELSIPIFCIIAASIVGESSTTLTKAEMTLAVRATIGWIAVDRGG